MPRRRDGGPQTNLRNRIPPNLRLFEDRKEPQFTGFVRRTSFYKLRYRIVDIFCVLDNCCAIFGMQSLRFKQTEVIYQMNRPLRVLQIAKHFEPDTGGIETVTRNISEMLLARGIQADVLCTEVSGPYVEDSRGYRVIRCKANASFGNKRFSFGYIVEGVRLQKSYDCAILHIPNPLGVAVALGWRKPVIPLWHADIPQKLIRKLSTPFDKLLLRKSPTVIGPTPIHLESSHLANSIGANRSIIPLPFDPSTVPSPNEAPDFAKKLRDFRRGRAMSISVGRLVPYKGIDILLEASKEFDDNLCVLIVGTGPLEHDLKAAIRNSGLENRVFLAGGLSKAELGEAFAQAKIGCLPSVSAAEMYGMVQLECMHAGLPMVSTNIERSGVSYVNKHEITGLIVEPSDPKPLAAAMLRLVNDEKLWNRLSQGAQQAVARDHNISSVAERYDRMIREVVGQASH